MDLDSQLAVLRAQQRTPPWVYAIVLGGAGAVKGLSMLMHPLTGDLRYYHAAGFRDWEAVAACVVAGLLGGLSGGHLKTRSRNLIIQFVGNCLLIVPFCGLVLVVFYRVGSWDRRMPLMYLTVCFVLSGIWTIFGAVLAAVEERIVTHPGSPT